MKMVASKKIHCVICNKKCSGNVLRYQDQYYHKQCFELDQSQEFRRQEQVGYGNHDSNSASHKSPSVSTPVSPPTTATTPALDTVDSGHHEDMNYPNSRYIHKNYHHSQSSIFTSTSTSNNLSNNQAITNGNPELRQQNQYSGSTSSGITRGRNYDAAMNASSNNNSNNNNNYQRNIKQDQIEHQQKSQTIDAREKSKLNNASRSATLPHSTSSPVTGFTNQSATSHQQQRQQFSSCAGCNEKIKDGQALIALDLYWHVWCFKCTQCQSLLHGEYVAKEGKAYCEKDYQKLFGVTCVYCKRYITGKVLQAGEAHHFHPSCARCSKCGDPFVPGEEMYLQGEVTWHPRCGPGPDSSSAHAVDEIAAMNMDASSRSHSRSASPFSYMSRQYGRTSPGGYAESEAVGDLSRIYTISYLNSDPTQGYLRRPIEPQTPKSPQFSRPTSVTRDDRSRCSSRSHSHLASSNNYHYGGSSIRERSVPRGMYSVLSSMSRGSQVRARSPSMMNEEAIHLAQYPSGQKPSPNAVPKIERDDFPAPPFPYSKHQRQQQEQQQLRTGDTDEAPIASSDAPKQQSQQRSSRPKSREIIVLDDPTDSSTEYDPQLRKEEEELSKIANGIGKIFLQTLKEREKLRAWKRANLDPRNASRTPSATRELSSRLRYDNPTNASPSRDMDRPRPWEDEDQVAGATSEHSPTRARSPIGQRSTLPNSGSQLSPSTYGYKVVQSNRSTPRPGYGLTSGPYGTNGLMGNQQQHASEMSFNQQQMGAQTRSSDLLARADGSGLHHQSEMIGPSSTMTQPTTRHVRPTFGSPHLRRSMPNMAQLNHLQHIHSDGPPKLYPYHLLATSNYRLPPDVDRCHLERHLANEEFQYIFHCDRLEFYRLPEWKRNELKRRAKLF